MTTEAHALAKASPSRRSIVRWLSALPIAAAAPVEALAAPAALTENPRLLSLGKALDRVANVMADALEEVSAARTEYERLCPPVPEDLVTKKSLEFAGCKDDETDCEGKQVWPPNYVGADGKTYARPTRKIIKAGLLKQAIVNGNLYASRRTKFGRRVHALIKIAEQFEAAQQAARDACGIEVAINARYSAEIKTMRLCRMIWNIPPRTTTGLLIKARSIVINAYSIPDHRHTAGGWYGLALAEQMMSIEGKGAEQWQPPRVAEIAARKAVQS